MFRSPYTKFYITSLSVTQIALTNKSSLREEVSLPSPAVTPRFYPTNLESRPLLQALPVCRAGSRSTSRFVVLPSRFAVLPSYFVGLRHASLSHVTLRFTGFLLEHRRYIEWAIVRGNLRSFWCCFGVPFGAPTSYESG